MIAKLIKKRRMRTPFFNDPTHIHLITIVR